MRRALGTRTGRTPAVQAARARSYHKTFAAPTKGWVTNQNLGIPLSEAALVLDNWFPQRTGIRVRAGLNEHADPGAGNALKALFTYQSGTVQKMFAADDAAIYDVTTSSVTTAVSSLTSGQWYFQQFGTVGGDFLLGCNGEDAPQIYDGSSWANATLTGTGLTNSDLSHVWSYAQRLFFVEKETKSFWYLPADAISGTLTEFRLNGVFNLGGSLLFGATWSLDTGDGLDDKLVLVTDLGEVAIYEGIDPASDFIRVGVYKLPKPLGPNAIQQVGGDLYIGTVEGLISLRSAIQRPPEEVNMSAVSRPIEPTWRETATERQATPWDITRWDEKSMLIVSTPRATSDSEAYCYVMNTEGNAWARYTGWNARAFAELNGQLYMATDDGKVHALEQSGSDDGAPYSCVYVGYFDHLRGAGVTKQAKLARATFRAAAGFEPKFSVSTDYQINLPTAPNSVPDEADVWDVGKWDSALWDANFTVSPRTRWRAVNGVGFVHAPQVQITFGVAFQPDAELQTFDLTAEAGRVVV